MPQVLCAKDVGRLLRRHEKTARRLLIAGAIKGWRPNGTGNWCTTERDVRRYLAQQRRKHGKCG
jgi:hypothetical protein